MKRGFTLIELIFVVLVIGILSAVLAPRFNRPTIDQAVNQIVSHIRYTQHLAMLDNKFDPTDQFWYRQRWQIQFQTTSGEEYYTIYSNRDEAGTNAIQNDIARNPLNPQQLFTGRKDISTNTAKYDKNMNLTEKYGITDISFSNSCSYRRSKRISFDYLGRPLYGNPIALDHIYIDGVTGNRLIQTQCVITLTDIDRNSRQIAIEPETGYTHIL
jgi:prepilin-type N-terminal cleavage/methylation domain-containing protein